MEVKLDFMLSGGCLQFQFVVVYNSSFSLSKIILFSIGGSYATANYQLGWSNIKYQKSSWK